MLIMLVCQMHSIVEFHKISLWRDNREEKER